MIARGFIFHDIHLQPHSSQVKESLKISEWKNGLQDAIIYVYHGWKQEVIYFVDIRKQTLLAISLAVTAPTRILLSTSDYIQRRIVLCYLSLRYYWICSKIILYVFVYLKCNCDMNNMHVFLSFVYWTKGQTNKPRNTMVNLKNIRNDLHL